MPQFKLFWSPCGKQIALVTADDSRAAIRKAPQPYRKYLGEIYAELVQKHRGVIVLKPGTLYAGVPGPVKSSWFTSRDSALDWLAAMRDNHESKIAHVYVEPSSQSKIITETYEWLRQNGFMGVPNV